MGFNSGFKGLKKARGLRVFKNWVLRKVFGSMTEQVTGEWRKRHNDELDGLYYLPVLFRWLNQRE